MFHFTDEELRADLSKVPRSQRAEICPRMFAFRSYSLFLWYILGHVTGFSPHRHSQYLDSDAKK